METINPIYKLHSIELLGKSLNERLSADPVIDATFEIQVEYKVNAELKLIFVVIRTMLKGVGSEENQEYGHITLSCIFEVQNFEEYILLESNNLYRIPKVFEVGITRMSISTLRGVLFSEFKGTYLGRIFLPIIPVPGDEENQPTDTFSNKP